MKPYAALALLLTTLLLSACGFHLRGTAFYNNLPFETVYVALPEASVFGRELLRNLRASNKTKVVANANEAKVILEIVDEKKTRSFLSLNVQGRAREYSLSYQVLFRVRDNNNAELLGVTRLAASRTLVYNELLALGREQEEDSLYREMQTDLVQQILRRLATIKLPSQEQKKAHHTPDSPLKEPNATAP
ncbi:MAG: hypothetical protein C4516_02885 [Oxalobacter sp.]|jgi:LPS-assembly lipoprotein|nr:MAG: hypothetical protein C4516_02885 [Oxalobacter sp.]